MKEKSLRKYIGAAIIPVLPVILDVLAIWSFQLFQAIHVVNCFEKKKFEKEEVH